jgi:hypothetical protein
MNPMMMIPQLNPYPLHKHVTSVPCLQSVQSDLGVTIVKGATSSSVSVWADQSGAKADYTQATPGLQPTYKSAGLNGFPTILFDGVTSQFLQSNLDLQPPGTLSTFIVIVYKLLSNPVGANGFISNSNLLGCCVFVVNSTSNVEQFNTTQANPISSTLSTWYRVEAFFNNSTSDYFKLGSTIATGTNSGNTNPGAFRYIGSNGGGSGVNIEIAALMIFSGKPTDVELLALGNAIRSKYSIVLT